MAGVEIILPPEPFVNPEDERVEQGILNISCNKMVYSETSEQKATLEGLDSGAVEAPDPTSASRNITNKSDQLPTDEVLLGVVIGCGMFFAFMLLGASVFIYCYCRAQRSAGNLGVRPRLSKIGDQWAVGTANNQGTNQSGNASSCAQSGNEGRSGRGAVSAQHGGYILKDKQTNDSKKGHSLLDHKSSSAKNGHNNKLPVLSRKSSSKKASFDGESSFVDFEHDSMRNSKEQSVESRHVAGECLLKIPEDRLRLLGSSTVTSLVCEQSTTTGATAVVVNSDSAMLVTTTAATTNTAIITTTATAGSVTNTSSITAEQLLDACSTAFLASSERDDTNESLVLPIVVKCDIVPSESRSSSGNLNGTVIGLEQSGLTANDAINIWQQQQPPHDQLSSFYENLENGAASHLISGRASVTSSVSTASSSPVASSIIYETLLINPPLSLTANKHAYHHQAPITFPSSKSTSLNNNNNNNYYNYSNNTQQLPPNLQPHKRFAMPQPLKRGSMPHQNNNNSNKNQSVNSKTADEKLLSTSSNSNNNANTTSDNNNTSQINPSPSKDSLSSVSGIIKLDIISAF